MREGVKEKQHDDDLLVNIYTRTHLTLNDLLVYINDGSFGVM